MSPLRDYWHLNLLLVRINFAWLLPTSWSVHLWVATWNSTRGWTVNVKDLLPDWLRALIPGRLFWQQAHHRRSRARR